MTKWSRENILRELLRRDDANLPLTSAGKEGGVDHALYQAASRVFGSWKNAVLAAGLPASRSRTNTGWTPGKIIRLIRSIARRKRPLTAQEIEQRHGRITPVARRYFGSWSKAILAAGVDPLSMRREPLWTADRILETILTRALRNESLRRRDIQPRSLAEAATRTFGSWIAALSAAGIDPNTIVTKTKPLRRTAAGAPKKKPRGCTTYQHSNPATERQAWCDRRILDEIDARVKAGLPLNAFAVHQDRPDLYSAARRRYRNWHATLLVAGLDAARISKKPPTNTR